MTSAEFQILSKSQRLSEFITNHDLDVVRYCISRTFSIPYDKVKNDIEIKCNFIRHELTLKTNPSTVIKILSTLPGIKLDHLSQDNDYIKFDMDKFFNKML